MTTALQTPAATRGRHVAAAAAVALAAAALAWAPEAGGEAARLGVVLVLQAALVAAWVLAVAPAGARGAAALALAAAVAADLLAASADPTGGPGPGVLLVVAGPALVVAVVHQMLRRPPRADVVGSLGTVALLVAAVCALALLLLPEVAGDAASPAASPLLVAGAALAAGHLADALVPRPAVADGVPRGGLGVLAALAAAVAVALAETGTAETVDVLAGLTTGLVVGLVAALAGMTSSFALADTAASGRRVPAAAAAGVEALLPLAVCAPALLALAVV
ncbi:hypothetical protein [Geodermatophilus sp. FMUSA9-8]|uniref:hypothetical protein n=1 Tax=Geodermatophilus sp. FMUSA9-8 TaxID=3120155 RepID=UPI00300A85FD